MANVLIIDDDQQMCNVLTLKVEGLGHQATSALTLTDGCRQATSGAFDVVYLDVRLPDGNGLDKLTFIQQVRSAPEIIIMTGLGDPDGAELAIKNGAWDYIQKPASLNNLVLPLVRALQYREAKLVQRPAVSLRHEGIVASSPQMKACFDQIAQAARTDVNVLISGETGTGKELIAWAVYNNSDRAKGSFIVVDCGALTETLVEGMLFGHEKGAYTGADKAHEGLIKQADGGTLFLDEVGELPFAIQRSFLRVLHERRYRPLGGKEEVRSDFRLLAATNRDLDQMVKDGRFRDDLLYRLRSFHIELAPLRERREDIADLALYHTRKICERYGMDIKGLSPDFLHMLTSYPWPGNVRELVNTLERSIAAAHEEAILIPKHLPMDVRVQVTRSFVDVNKTEAHPCAHETSLPTWKELWIEAQPRIEKQYLHDLLRVSGDNITRACGISGLSRSHLYGLVKKYSLLEIVSDKNVP